MKYRIETEYAWYDTPEGSKVILVYFIQNVPFTFDELPEIARNLPEVTQSADGNKRWSTEEMYKASMYLMAEECHPMMYELEIENPELLPVDWCLCSSVVEQGFCKAQVASSNLVEGFGELAQLVERLLCKQDVSGSSPLFSTCPSYAADIHSSLAQWQSKRLLIARS